MKNIYILFAFMAFSFINAQSIPVTFENGNGIVLAESFIGDSGVTVALAADPDTSGGDHGQTGKSTTDTTGAAWQNTQIFFQEGSNYADFTTNKVITFECYSTVAFYGLLKLESSLNGQAPVQTTFQHNGGGWESISVDFTSVGANDEFKKIVFFPYSTSTAGTFLTQAEIDAMGNFDYYLDNVTADVGTLIATPAPTAAATAPTANAADVVSVYSDHYTATATTVAWHPAWGQTTSYEEFDLNGDGSDVMAKLSSFGYEGITFDAMSITSETLHLDVWSSDETSLKVFIDNNNAVTKTLTTGQWNSIDIPISDFTALGVDITAVSFVKLESGTWTYPNGTSLIYVDNIYFHSQPSDDTVITFTVDTNNSPYPSAGKDNVVINYSQNGWGGWGVTLVDDGTAGDSTSGDGIYSGQLTLPKSTGAVEYVVAVTGSDDGWSGWGDQSGASALCVDTAGNFSFTTGANTLAQDIVLLDDVSGDHWACLTSDAKVTVTIVVDATSPDAAHPQNPDAATAGSTFQLAGRTNLNGWGDYGIVMTNTNNVWTGTIEASFYANMEYVINADGPDNGWAANDAQSANANGNTNFVVNVGTSDVTEELTVTAENADGNWVVYTSTLSVGDVEVDLTFNFYPNPVVDLVSLDARESIQAVQVYDLTGRVVLHKNINATKAQLDLGNLQKGVYILEAKINDQTAVTKFVKQ